MTDRPAGLLPSLAAGSAAGRRLRGQLTVLARSGGGGRGRRGLRAAPDGRASLRALALSGHFADALAPLVERGMRDYVEPHGLAALELAEQADRELAADRAGSAG